MRAAKFRETYWFKMGAATEKAEPPAADETAPADELRPVEDRYNDAALSLVDQAEFGLHTGSTSAIPLIPRVEPVHVPEETLIAEMRSSRPLYIGAVFAAVAAIAATAAFLI